MFIAVEGNIGAGKSCLIDALNNRLRNMCCDVAMLQEPLDKWTNYFGFNMLKALYDNKQYWGFRFQIMTLIDSVRNEIEASKYTGFVLVERTSLSTLNVFSKALCTDIEINILKDLRSLFSEYTNPDIVIYLRTLPNICYQRVINRGRKEEIGS